MEHLVELEMMTSTAAWYPFAKAAAIAWVPLTKRPLPSPPKASKRAMFDEKIIMNVSGKRFECWSSTLARFPDSLLGSNEKEFFFDEDNNEYFFDRDPELFRHIINFYRTGKLHFPRGECVSAYEEELAYFGLAQEMIGECCYEEYLERRREVFERTQDIIVEDDDMECVTDPKTVREKIWKAFEFPHSSKSALFLYYVLGVFIALSVLTNLIETVSCGRNITSNKTISCGLRYPKQFFVIDTACVLIFTVEYLLRLYASANRMKFVKSVMSIIDLVAIMPYYTGLAMSTKGELGGAFVTLRVFRVFRIFKFSRHSQGLRILGYTLKSCAKELGFLVFSMSLVIVIFATTMYYTERNVPDTTFVSIPVSAWYTIVTLTTLGYGDMVPQTWFGKLVGGLCALSGVLVIALPVPVIVNNFSRIYSQSQRSDKVNAQKKSQQSRLHQAKVAITNAYIKYRKDLKSGNSSIESELDNIQHQHFYLLGCLEAVTGRDFLEYSNMEPPPIHESVPRFNISTPNVVQGLKLSESPFRLCWRQVRRAIRPSKSRTDRKYGNEEHEENTNLGENSDASLPFTVVELKYSSHS